MPNCTHGGNYFLSDLLPHGRVDFYSMYRVMQVERKEMIILVKKFSVMK